MTDPPAGLGVVVRCDERAGVRWVVPATGPLTVGCHIPGHRAKGMQMPVRFVAPASVPGAPDTGDPATGSDLTVSRSGTLSTGQTPDRRGSIAPPGNHEPEAIQERIG